MKKYLVIVLTLSALSFCYAADLTSYKNVVPVLPLTISQPSIVEISNLNQSGNYVLTTTKGEVINQQFKVMRVSKVIQPQQVEACTITCSSAKALVDGDEKTTFDFPLVSKGLQKGTIKIVYTLPLETDGIVFKTTNDSYLPSAFTLTIDGKRILNTIQGGSVRFPKMIAKTVDIEFEYNQPIRFTEVGIGSNTEVNVTSSIRFVYQPNETYLLYQDSSLGRESLPTSSIDLFSKKVEAVLTLGEVSKNTLYKEKDSDGDGVIDSIDNCPMQKNTDQKDSNNNGVGDVCDDYDYDGVMTAYDNCPTVANPDQLDSDKDGIGDACDTEESRITERYTWIPWAVFALVFLAVIGMGYEVLKKKKEEIV